MLGALVSPANNWIALSLEDHGVLTAFDMTVTIGTKGGQCPAVLRNVALHKVVMGAVHSLGQLLVPSLKR